MKADKQTVSVLGCGWLGLPLAISLVDLGYKVFGSTTTQDKIDNLKKQNIVPYLLRFPYQCEKQNLPEIFSSDIFFINLPFKRSFQDPSEYHRQISSIVEHIQTDQRKFIIFASSTSVYPSQMKEARESIIFEPENERSKVLREIEQMLMKDERFDATIIRFAGLYGGDRRIGKFLAGKTDMANPLGPINLIHLDDCVQIVEGIIKQDVRQCILNACSDKHPTRQELYTKAAENMGLQPPSFKESAESKTKIVCNDQLKAKLSYNFIHPDPLKSLDR